VTVASGTFAIVNVPDGPVATASVVPRTDTRAASTGWPV
jgi:hypothetical protein